VPSDQNILITNGGDTEKPWAIGFYVSGFRRVLENPKKPASYRSSDSKMNYRPAWDLNCIYQM